jgi:hypothetical protein
MAARRGARGSDRQFRISTRFAVGKFPWLRSDGGHDLRPPISGIFDTADDTRTAGTTAGITIGGTVNGAAAAGDHFAFLATTNTALGIGGNQVTLQARPTNDDLVPAIVTTGDLSVVELGPTPA